MTDNAKKPASLIITGYVFSILPLLILPIVFTPVGVALGVVNITKQQITHGILQIIIAVIMGITGASIGGAGLVNA